MLIERDAPGPRDPQDLGLGMMLWMTHFFPQEPWAVTQRARSLAMLDRLWVDDAGYFCRGPGMPDVRFAFTNYGVSIGLQAVGASPERVRRVHAFFEGYRSGDEYDREAITHVMACSAHFPGYLLQGYGQDLTQLAVLAAAPVVQTGRALVLVPLFLARHAQAHAGHGLASRLRNLVTAFLAVTQARPARQLRLARLMASAMLSSICCCTAPSPAHPVAIWKPSPRPSPRDAGEGEDGKITTSAAGCVPAPDLRQPDAVGGGVGVRRGRPAVTVPRPGPTASASATGSSAK